MVNMACFIQISSYLLQCQYTTYLLSLPYFMHLHNNRVSTLFLINSILWSFTLKTASFIFKKYGFSAIQCPSIMWHIICDCCHRLVIAKNEFYGGYIVSS